jgi:hypothetical protein
MTSAWCRASGNGFTLDVSGYYKDVKNLIQQANFIDDRAGYQVSSYFNLDYANVRGFRVALAGGRAAHRLDELPVQLRDG